MIMKHEYWLKPIKKLLCIVRYKIHKSQKWEERRKPKVAAS
jgi:hypothetical protein